MTALGIEINLTDVRDGFDVYSETDVLNLLVEPAHIKRIEIIQKNLHN